MAHLADWDPGGTDSRATLPDTGARQTFATGEAVREADPNKPAVEGISPYAMERIGLLYTRGGEKYGDFRNWEKGMPFTRCIGAIIRHVFAYLRRDNTEDHLAAVAWNAIALMHYEAVGNPDLDDRPTWGEENARVLPDSEILARARQERKSVEPGHRSSDGRGD